MACLLHEKPFQGVNGSGKHNNWSLASDTGINMLEPGVTPHENIQFLLVLACIMKPWTSMQTCSVSRQPFPETIPSGSPGGAAGHYLHFRWRADRGRDRPALQHRLATHSKMGGTLRTGVTTLPDFDKDATDRNRTSPFAFTGNKFEFRMVGSRDSVAGPNVVINTIVAEAFKEACDVLESSDDFDMAVHDLIKKYAYEHQRIIFNGNGYSDEWVEEAGRRGLPNIRSW